MTAWTAVTAMAGSFAWHLHAQHRPRLPTGTVPILDMIELRNRGAHLLFRAQGLLAPFAKGITPDHASRAALGAAVPRSLPDRSSSGTRQDTRIRLPVW